MELDFLSPAGALVALAAIVPLAAMHVVDRRNARARALLGLPAPEGRARLVLPAAAGLLAAFLGLAAAQPVLRIERSRALRLDAEVMVAVDTSRSMAAAASATAPARIDRARTIAYALSAELRDIPIGLGTFTDRPLPVVLPTPDTEAFTSAVRDSLGIEHPPGLGTSVTISSYDAVAPFPLEGYFGPKAKRRLLVVITDAESSGFNEAGARTSFGEKPRTRVVVVRVGSGGERVYGPDGYPESEYIPPPGTGETLKRFLAATRGRSFAEDDLAGALGAARAALGTGPVARVGTASDRRDLAPWLVLAGIFPLGLVLRRRNF